MEDDEGKREAAERERAAAAGARMRQMMDQAMRELMNNEEFKREAILSLDNIVRVSDLRRPPEEILRDRAVKEALEKAERERIAPAHNARRKEQVDDIIRECTLSLWKSKPRFETNLKRTATNIRAKVLDGIAGLSEILPNGWEDCKSDDPLIKIKQIERIRQRIRRLVESGRLSFVQDK